MTHRIKIAVAVAAFTVVVGAANQAPANERTATGVTVGTSAVNNAHDTESMKLAGNQHLIELIEFWAVPLRMEAQSQFQFPRLNRTLQPSGPNHFMHRSFDAIV